MIPLSLFGLLAVTAKSIFYATEERGPVYIPGFARGCALASIYGLLQGAWPFGILTAIWVAVAVRRRRAKVSS